MIGGGNTAATEALHLSHIANSVTIVHRRDSLRADKIVQDRIFNNQKISVEWDSVVEQIVGTENPKSVTGIVLKNIKTDQIKEFKVDGVFISIGHKPNTEIFRKYIELTPAGFIVTKPGTCETSVPGVFAAGDVINEKYRQAIIAAGSGAQALLEAQNFLQVTE